MFEPITVNGRSFPVAIERRAIRNAVARVRDDRVVITLPERMGAIRSALVSRDLYRQISVGIAKRPQRYIGMPKLEFRHGQKLSLLGKPFFINMVVSEGLARPSTGVRGAEVTVNIPALDYADRDAILSKLARKALTRHLMGEVEAEVARLNSAHFGSEISEVRLRNMECTWGSYSSERRSITLNFRLLFAPSQVLEYVIVHELAHTKVMGHSRRFWGHVCRVLPDYRQRRRWLREHANELCPQHFQAQAP